jgi:hypothetical protein
MSRGNGKSQLPIPAAAVSSGVVPKLLRSDSVMNVIISPRDENPGNQVLKENLAIVYAANGDMHDSALANEKYSRLFNGYYIRGFAEKMLFNCHYDIQRDPNHFIPWVKTYLFTMFVIFFGEQPNKEPELPAWILNLTPFKDTYNSFSSATKQRIIAEVFDAYVYAISEQITEISHEEFNESHRRRLNGFNYFLAQSFGIQWSVRSPLNTRERILQRAFYWHTKYYDRPKPAETSSLEERESDRSKREQDAADLNHMFGWFAPNLNARKKPNPAKADELIPVPVAEKDFVEVYTDWEESESYKTRFIENPPVLSDDARSIISKIKDEIARLRQAREGSADIIESVLKGALKKYFSRINDELEYSRLVLLHVLPCLFQNDQTAYFNILRFVMTVDLRFGFEDTFYRIGTPYSMLDQKHRNLQLYEKANEVMQLDKQLAQQLENDFCAKLEQDFACAKQILHLWEAAGIDTLFTRRILLHQLQHTNGQYLTRVADGYDTYEAYQQQHQHWYQREHKNVEIAFRIKTIIEAALLSNDVAQMDAAIHCVNDLMIQASGHDKGFGVLYWMTNEKVGGSELYRNLNQVMPDEPEFVRDNYDAAYRCELGKQHIDWDDHPLVEDIQYLEQNRQQLADGRHLKLKSSLGLALHCAISALKSERNIAAAEKEVLQVAKRLMGVLSKDPRIQSIKIRIEKKLARQAEEAQQQALSRQPLPVVASVANDAEPPLRKVTGESNQDEWVQWKIAQQRKSSSEFKEDEAAVAAAIAEFQQKFAQRVLPEPVDPSALSLADAFSAMGRELAAASADMYRQSTPTSAGSTPREPQVGDNEEVEAGVIPA